MLYSKLICKTLEVYDLEGFLNLKNLPDADYRVIITNDIDFKPYRRVDLPEEESILFEKVQSVFSPIDLNGRKNPIIIDGRGHTFKNMVFAYSDKIELFKNYNGNISIRNINYENVSFINGFNDTEKVVKSRKLKKAE